MFGKLFSDSFFKHNVIFFVGSLIVAALNYLFHPVMSRMLSVEEFGEVQALISLTYITGVILTVYKTTIVHLSSHDENSDSENDRGVRKGVMQRITSLTIYAIGVFSVFLLVFSGYIMESLQLTSQGALYVLILLLFAGVPFAFYGSYLQGRKKFGLVSVSNIILATSKIFIAVALVLLGLSVFGAVASLVLSTTAGLLFLYYHARGKVDFRPSLRLWWDRPLAREISYSFLILCSLGFVMFFFTSDVLFVKYFFSPEDAGLYSGIATIGRIIFFATASVSAVLLPTISLRASASENMHVLHKACLFIGGLGLVALGGFFFLGEFVIRLLIGSEYLVYASLLPLVGVYIFLISVINVFYAYFLALRDRRIIGTSLIGIIVLLYLVVLRHETVRQIIENYIVSSAVVLLLLLFSLLIVAPQRRDKNAPKKYFFETLRRRSCIPVQKV